MKTFSTIKEVLGYSTKPDVTNNDPRFLVKNSQNCLINDGEKVQTRKGYTRDGSATAQPAPKESFFNCFPSPGVERNMRCYDDGLEVRFALEGEDADWYRVK